jgi:hypothetical protein
MKDDVREVRRVPGHANEPAIQVICLVSLVLDIFCFEGWVERRWTRNARRELQLMAKNAGTGSSKSRC